MLPVPGSSRTSPFLRKPRLWTSEASSDPLPRNTHHAGLLPDGGADLSAKGCEAALKSVTLVWLIYRMRLFCCRFPSVRGQVRSQKNERSWTSEALSDPLLRNTHHAGLLPEGVGADRATLRLSAKGCEAALKSVTLVCLIYRMRLFCCRFPAVRGQVRSYENRDCGQAKRRPIRSHAIHITPGFCPEGERTCPRRGAKRP